MTITLSKNWESSDLDTTIYQKHIDRRDKIEVKRVDIDNGVSSTVEIISTGDTFFTNRTGKTIGDFWKSNKIDHTIGLNTFGFHIGLNSNSDTRTIQLEGIRCITGANCYGEDIIVGLEAEIRLWSNPHSWSDNREQDTTSQFLDSNGNKRIPEAGDNVEVKPGWNMILDIDTPVVTMLKINGRLRFMEFSDASQELVLSAKHLFVRNQGELLAGSLENDQRYPNRVKIVMHGKVQSQYITDDEAFESGHKEIVNTGKIELFGLDTENSMTRLTATAEPGSTTIHVEHSSQEINKWKAGDWIGLAPTSYSYQEGERRQIKEIKANGEIELEVALLYQHYGSSD